MIRNMTGIVLEEARACRGSAEHANACWCARDFSVPRFHGIDRFPPPMFHWCTPTRLCYLYRYIHQFHGKSFVFLFCFSNEKNSLKIRFEININFKYLRKYIFLFIFYCLFLLWYIYIYISWEIMFYFFMSLDYKRFCLIAKITIKIKARFRF